MEKFTPGTASVEAILSKQNGQPQFDELGALADQALALLTGCKTDADKAHEAMKAAFIYRTGHLASYDSSAADKKA